MSFLFHFLPTSSYPPSTHQTCFLLPQEFNGVDGCEENAAVADTGVLEFVCKLLGLENPQDFAFALTTLRTVTRGAYVCLSGRLPVCLSTCLFVCPSVCLSACLPSSTVYCSLWPVCLSVCMYVCLSYVLPVH